MNEVEEYILRFEGAKRELLLFFHALFIEEYNLRPKISYRIPFYYRNKWVVYLNSDNKDGVEVAFTQGYKFPSNNDLLESKDRKMIRSVEFKRLEEIPDQEFRKIMKQAIEIDDLFINQRK